MCTSTLRSNEAALFPGPVPATSRVSGPADVRQRPGAVRIRRAQVVVDGRGAQLAAGHVEAPAGKFEAGERPVPSRAATLPTDEEPLECALAIRSCRTV